MFWTTDRIYSQGIDQAQSRIYEFFLEAVRYKSTEEVIDDFKTLFINLGNRQKLEIVDALNQILIAYNEKEFFCTLKRCCYILINNWTVSNNRIGIQALIDVFKHPLIHKQSKYAKIQTLRIWLRQFVESEEFQALNLFNLHLDDKSNVDRQWSSRFASYLLAYDYGNPASSLEQRQAANLLAQKMNDKFKFDLAKYTAHLNPRLSTESRPRNPTSLSDNILNISIFMLTKKSELNCQEMADKFLRNNKDICYQDFKTNLLKYLDFSIADFEISETLQNKLHNGLLEFKSERHDYPVSTAMILKASKYLINEITICDRGYPTELFNILIHHTNPLNFVVLLLKILLINDSIRLYLELRLASIIKYYSQYSESKCKSVITFIDILNIGLAIYAGKTRYNIIKMNPYEISSNESNHLDSQILKFDTKQYRIFSQVR
jgi:hypothetical protein